MRYIKSVLFILLISLCMKTVAGDFEKDTVQTSGGDLVITLIGHGTLMFEFDGKTIHVDPSSDEADYDLIPDADIVLITHHHGDHFDKKAIEKIVKTDTRIVLTKKCSENAAEFKNLNVIGNGSELEIYNIKIEAVPAYNMVHKRPNGDPFHVKGEGNGYIVNFGNKKVYIAGDTENIPEMKSLKKIDIAFLPMNLPYTMTPEMVADAAIGFKPAVLYPYHYGNTDTGKLTDLLKNEKGIEVRIRRME